MSTRAERITALKAAARERILILDGAWGVMIQRADLSEDDFRGERFKLGPVTLAEEFSLAPGELRVERGRVLAGTATHAVVLGEVQAQGKKRMAATDWARGTRIEQGERLT